MVPPARVRFIVQTRPRFENPPLTETMSSDSPCSPENTLVVAVPPDTRQRTTVVVQVRTGGHLSFGTPRRHQGCDSLPQIIPRSVHPFVAQQLLSSHTHMGCGSAGLPPMQCSECPLQPSQLMTRAQQEAALPAELPGEPNSLSIGCEGTVSILAVSCNLPRSR